MRDLQIGDIITVPALESQPEAGKLEIQGQILYIPRAPGEPWVIRDVETQHKWRVWTSGPFMRTAQHRG